MKRRWYDQYPTMSMAVSLLQNTAPVFREQTTQYMNERIQTAHPEAWAEAKQEQPGIWKFLQQRRGMNEDAWLMVERLRYVPEDAREKLAVELIRYVYCLEHLDDSNGLELDPVGKLHAVL